MPEQIQQIINRIVDWWKKFTSRQKILIISAASVIVVALAILGYVVTRPTMIELISCTSASQSSTVQDLLTGEGITFETSADGMIIYIKEEDRAAATILLGTNEIPNEGYTIDDVVDGSFSTTEANKKKRYQVYLESTLEEQLATLNAVRSAQVTLYIPDDNGTIIASNEESYARVILDVDSTQIEDPNAWAANIAKYIATGLGNDTTENITILDGNGNSLFAGGDEVSSAGMASSNQAARQAAETAMASKVRSTFASTSDGSIFDAVDVGVNLSMSFDKKSVTKYDYSVDEGRTEGYLDSRQESNTESTSGTGGVPGTDSNDDTTYVIDDNNYTHTTTSDVSEDYLPDEEITQIEAEVGAINSDESSITIVATNYVVYNEDSLKADGTLDDMTFDEFVAQNSEKIQTEVDDTVFKAVSDVTGIPQTNISIIAYDVPMFQYSDGGRDITDYLQIVIALLVFALLGFLVFRSLRSEEEAEVEDEISVDDLIEATKDEPLEDIGFSDKSEARILIEKFVDENPEAVANLLRNWLNDDWG